jgi:PAS domain S-box-containing protein
MNTKHNILIVDDDPDFRENLSGILRDEGYAPVTAVTGKEAMEMVRGDEFAVVLIDLRLEDMSGVDVMKEIKTRSPMTEGVFITGYATQSSAIDAVKLAVYSYVEKPFNVGQLLETIRMAIEKQKVGKALRESEERYRTLFEGSRDAIYITSGDNQFVELNQASLELFGYTRAEFMMMKPSEIYLNPGDPINLKKEIEHKGYVKDHEVKFGKSDGEQMTCLITSTGRLANDGSIVEYQNIVRDITEQNQHQRRLQETLEMLRRNLDGVIQCVALVIEKKDPYTAGHQRRVTDLACAIAQEMGLSEGKRDAIRMAGIIHDIGKISIPAEILSKPGRLTEIEFSLLKTHPHIGHDILKEIEWPYPIAEIVLQHHERMDGSGYPHCLSGEEIMMEARVLGVADVVEAMASNRPYRPGLGIDKTLEEISNNRGVLYDSEAADACLKVFAEKGFEWD